MLAIDPGRDKCGLALLDEEGRVLRRAIVSARQVAEVVKTWMGDGTVVVLGNATASRQAAVELERAGIEWVEGDEKGSSMEARALYWQANPPRGILKLIPRSFLVPPRPIDDWAAVVVGRRYLQRQKQRRGSEK